MSVSLGPSLKPPTLSTSPRNSVDALKRQIKTLSGMKRCLQVIGFPCEPFDDSSELHTAGLLPGSTITLECHLADRRSVSAQALRDESDAEDSDEDDDDDASSDS